MYDQAFRDVIQNIPKNRAVFEVTSIPTWANKIVSFDLQLGDICYSVSGASKYFTVFNTRTKKKQGGIGANLTFLRYEPEV